MDTSNSTSNYTLTSKKEELLVPDEENIENQHQKWSLFLSL